MYKSIQGCRAIAALLVVFFHLGGALASSKYFSASLLGVMFSSGDAGVYFFFVLSGFVITHAHLKDLGNSSRLAYYLAKRAIRIYPAYWIIFSGIYFLAISSPALRSTVPYDPIILVKSLLLIPQDTFVSGGTGAPVLIVAWSLQYEIGFYLLFAVFIFSRLAGILLSVAVLSLVFSCHIRTCDFPITFLSSPLITLFGMGVLIACIHKGSFRFEHPLHIAVLATVGLLALAFFETVVGKGFLPIDRSVSYGGLSAVGILALVGAEDAGYFKDKYVGISVLGNASYALYLLHFPIISGICKLLVLAGLHGITGAIVALPVVLCLCLSLSIAFHYFVEAPAIGLISAGVLPYVSGYCARRVV